MKGKVTLRVTIERYLHLSLANGTNFLIRLNFFEDFLKPFDLIDPS